ncbi:hypothetical protein Tco_0912157 [Tanacetum coccineum]
MNLVPKELLQVVVPGNTLQSDEDRLKLDELMALCTTLQNRVLDLEKTKNTEHNEIASLKRRVKKLEKKNMSRTHKLKRLYKVDEEITLVSVAADKVSTASDATIVSAATTTTATITTVDDITLAQALEEIKSTKPKQKGVVIQELAKFDEEEILAREKAKKEKEANIALIETWDDIQEKIDDDHQLAEILQAQEQEELFVEEKATLFQQLLEKRRKHFVAKREEENRNKPPIKAQQRKIMCTYLKNMEGYKLNDLKLKEFDSISSYSSALPDEELEELKEGSASSGLMLTYKAQSPSYIANSIRRRMKDLRRNPVDNPINERDNSEDDNDE